MNSYVRLSKAYYGSIILKQDPDLVEEFHVQIGEEASILFKWVKLGGKIAVKLESFDDSWECFSKCPELFSNLSNSVEISPGGFEKMLKQLNFKDKTKTKEC